MKHFFVLLILFAFFITRSQDSTSTFPRHEFGFNSVWLFKQLTGNNSYISDQPYVIFYNYYFHPKFNARLGLGGGSGHYNTKGSELTDSNEQLYRSVDARLGGSYNLVSTSKLTLNAFVDCMYSSYLQQSIRTSTTQPFESSTFETTTLDTYKQRRIGGRAGMGIKYNLLKNLSLYAEIPVTMVYQITLNESTVRAEDEEDQVRSVETKGYSSWIIPPATIYLILRL